jgi:hypothetical protein
MRELDGKNATEPALNAIVEGANPSNDTKGRYE